MKKIIFKIFFLFLFSLVSVSAMNAQTNSDSQTAKSKDDKNTPLRIIKKTFAGTPQSCPYQSSGLTQVRATFDKTEKVTAVELVKSSDCDEFDREAIKAAYKIKFKPALKDGEPQTVTKPIEYRFRRY